MLRLLAGAAVFPFVLVGMFAAGFACAVAYLVAVPFLFLWERHRERSPFKPKSRAKISFSRPAASTQDRPEVDSGNALLRQRAAAGQAKLPMEL